MRPFDKAMHAFFNLPENCFSSSPIRLFKKNMKPIIGAREFLLSVAVILIICDKKIKCFTSEDVANDLKFIKMCKSNSPPGAYSMNDVLETKSSENTHSRAFKCFLHCLLTKYGWMDDDGGYLLHDIRETLQQSDVQLATLEYILYTCTAVKSSDRCQRAHFFTDCFWKKMDEEQPTADELFYNVKTRK